MGINKTNNIIVEERKEKEIEYYNKRAEEWLKEKGEKELRTDFEGFNPNLLSSYAFCYKILKNHCQNKRVLDYGCGTGVHSIFPAKYGAKVYGIDISEKSLRIF